MFINLEFQEQIINLDQIVRLRLYHSQDSDSLWRVEADTASGNILILFKHKQKGLAIEFLEDLYRMIPQERRLSYAWREEIKQQLES